MDQKFVDAITNVRLVSGTIRIDLMNITGQTEDNKLQFSKTGELILSQQAFGQALDQAFGLALGPAFSRTWE